MATVNPQEVPELVELIFANRNKAYGAYELRKIFPSFYRRAAVLGILLVGTAISAPLLITKFGLNKKEKEVNVVAKLENLPPPPPINKNEPPPPPPPVPPPPVRPTVRFVEPVVKKDAEVRDEEPPPMIEEMENKDISTKTQEGDINAKPVVEDVVYVEAAPKEEEKKVVETPPKEEKPKEPEIFTFVEQNPEFPGGAAAMNEYLQTNIQYPEIARRAGIEGPVFVQFVVDEAGRISQAQVVRSIGGGCDEEALRVVNAMPAWRPGKQNGQPVKVRYTVQVRFRLR